MQRRALPSHQTRRAKDGLSLAGLVSESTATPMLLVIGFMWNAGCGL